MLCVLGLRPPQGNHWPNLINYPHVVNVFQLGDPTRKEIVKKL